MKCAACGRPITGVRSLARERGPSCWSAHLDTLPLEEWRVAEMRGYATYWEDDTFVVVGPEHQVYHVTVDGCNCVQGQAYQQGYNKTPCRHMRWREQAERVGRRGCHR